MPKSKTRALVKAVVSVVAPPEARAAMTIAEALAHAVGGPDLAATETAAILEQFEFLQRTLTERIDEIRAAGVTTEEAYELAHQTMAHMARAARDEKRRLLLNVLVNGLTDPSGNTRTRRIFLRLVDDLDVDHVAILRTGLGSPKHAVTAPDGELGLLLLADLRARRLIEPTPSTLGDMVDLAREHEEMVRAAARSGGGSLRPLDPAPSPEEAERDVSLSPLGIRFVEHLRDVGAE